MARSLHQALSQVLLGTPRAVTIAVVAAMSGNHLLIEDVPGVGKTVLARALATALGVQLSRVQGHPDLLPSDVTGVTVFSPDTQTWDFRPGPVFGHVVLLDELNRTPPRTQSALLEAMEEQQVSVDGESWPLPRPHLVIGTQNPVGQLGTYPLVESQLDRFGLSTTIGYPDAEVETRLVLHSGGRYALDNLVPVSDPTRWERAIAATATVHVVDVGGRVRRLAGPGHPDGRHRPARGQPPGGHLADPLGPGLRRAHRPGLRHPPGRPGGGGGLPGPPADRRGERWGRSRHWWAGSWPRRPSPRREHAPGGAGRPAARTRGWRGITTAATGIVAGVCGVVVVRTVVRSPPGGGRRPGRTGGADRRHGHLLGGLGPARPATRRRPVCPGVDGSVAGSIRWRGWPRWPAAWSPCWPGPAWPTPAGRVGSRPSVPCWPPSCSPGWWPRCSRPAGQRWSARRPPRTPRRADRWS